jgi:hypothetical protein
LLCFCLFFAFFIWLATGWEDERNAKDVATGCYEALQLLPLDVIASTVHTQAIKMRSWQRTAEGDSNINDIAKRLLFLYFFLGLTQAAIQISVYFYYFY